MVGRRKHTSITLGLIDTSLQNRHVCIPVCISRMPSSLLYSLTIEMRTGLRVGYVS